MVVKQRLSCNARSLDLTNADLTVCTSLPASVGEMAMQENEVAKEELEFSVAKRHEVQQGPRSLAYRTGGTANDVRPSTSPGSNKQVEKDTPSWRLNSLPLELGHRLDWRSADEILQYSPATKTKTVPSEEAEEQAENDLENTSIAHTSSSNTAKIPSKPIESSSWKGGSPGTTAFGNDFLASRENIAPQTRIPALNSEQLQRARLYSYYAPRVDKLQILCDSVSKMNDFPTHCKADYDLLRALTRTHSSQRWWTILIDNLACAECVAQLRAGQKAPHSRPRKMWWKAMRGFRRMCHCERIHRGLKCTHRSRDTNKVSHFHHALGRRSIIRMTNIELDTKEWPQLDPCVLASAIHNLKLYFPNVQNLRIRFHLGGVAPVSRAHLGRVVYLLARLEALLPWRGRLMVVGFEGQEACGIAWGKWRRRWWE